MRALHRNKVGGRRFRQQNSLPAAVSATAWAILRNRQPPHPRTDPMARDAVDDTFRRPPHALGPLGPQAAAGSRDVINPLEDCDAKRRHQTLQCRRRSAFGPPDDGSAIGFMNITAARQTGLCPLAGGQARSHVINARHRGKPTAADLRISWPSHHLIRLMRESMPAANRGHQTHSSLSRTTDDELRSFRTLRFAPNR
jgi:hypothetical protein